MYFDPNLLCYRRKGKFAKCWLAATNPSLFRKYCKKAEIERICINDLCSDIEKTLQNQRNMAADPERRFSLIVASQLTFGVVSIYRQQVEILYERSSTLICFQRVVISDINSAQKKKASGKNGAKLQLDTTTFAEVMTLTEPFDLGPMPVDNGSLTIRESSLAYVEENPPVNDGFGEMSAQEKLDFMDVLEGRRPMADLFVEDMQSTPEKSSAKRKDVFQYPGTSKRSKKSKPTVVPDATVLSEEFDLTRQTISNWNQTDLTMNHQLSSNVTASLIDPEMANTLNELNESVDIPRAAISGVPMEIDMASLSLELPNISVKEPIFDLNNNSVELESPNLAIQPPEVLDPQPCTSFAVATISKNAPILSKPKRSRKRKLKVDKQIEIDGHQMRDQIENFLDTLRDYPDRVDLKKQRRPVVFNRPNRQCGKELVALFTRRCKVRAVASDDDTILDKVLGIERTPVDNLQTSVVSTSNEIQQEFIELPPVIIETPSQPIAEPVEPLLEKLSAPPAKHYSAYQVHQMTHCELKTEWGEQSLMRKLSTLWDNGVQPIDMSVLCRRATRLEAAFAFSTLLCLKKAKLVDLAPHEDSRAIKHIVPGVKFVVPLMSAASA